jgi:hypothetical protein
MTISGYITRSNMPTTDDPSTGLPWTNLEIAVAPYYFAPGDDSFQADNSTQNGVSPNVSVHQQIWADSPVVPGKQLVYSKPDNSELILRLLIKGSSMADAQTKLAAIINAVTLQLSYTVVVEFDTAPIQWTCYTGDYQVAYNEVYMIGYLPPLYLDLPCAPGYPVPLVAP